MEFAIDPSDAGAVIEVLGRGAEACRAAACREGSVERLPARGRLIATGDLHDNPSHLAAVLRLARLSASPDHHVTLHELIHGENLINGMDFSHRMLIRAAELKARFPEQVHLILANHEIAQMTGRGVSKGAGDSVELFNEALDWAYGDEAPAVGESIRAFLRAWPIAVRTESGVLCAHSVPADHVMEGFDAGLLERELEDADFEPRVGSAYLMTWGRRQSAEHLERLAERWGVKLFVLGHQHAETGIEALGRNAIVLNSDHEMGMALPIDLAAEPVREELLWCAQSLRALA